MRKQLFFVSLLAAALLSTSCGSRRVAPSGGDIEFISEVSGTVVSVSPRVAGFVPNMIMLAGRENESLFKVEILAGKEMEIDCNHHGLAGEFEKRTLDNGETVLFFNSTGTIFSTQMACLDDTRRTVFVSAQPHFVPYNSAIPLTVYTPAGISVRHRIWEASEMQPLLTDVRYANNHVLSAFPTEKEGFERFILLLPYSNTPDDLKVEIIPGQVAYVDCNRHVLSGSFSREIVDGWGFDYYVFTSDGIMAATRMACIDPPVRTFVPAATEFVRYNGLVPIVVFAPVGFEVRYRIWEAEAR